MQFRSVIEHNAWPAVATGLAAEIMALQRQLDATQWWPPEQLRAHQFQQLRLLLIHAAAQVPFQAQRLRQAGIDPAAEITESTWSRIPILTRRDVQELGDELNARSVPPSHGAVSNATSGGSSGVPVRVRKTALENLFWNALHVREEIWHRDDPLGLIARVRRVPPGVTPEQRDLIESGQGLVLPDWGPPTSLLWKTGQIVLLDDRVPIPEQVASLQEMQPTYLHSFPSNLRLLLAHCRETGVRVPSIRSVWTMSETVDPTMRELCCEILGAASSTTTPARKPATWRCNVPSGEHFHVQSEALYLEVLRPDGQPCEPGEIGRVVVTPLHNFATPLLRYEIGDEAEFGGPCPCGRGLPVLRRIVGRTFEYVTLPSGRRRRVDTGYYRLVASLPCGNFRSSSAPSIKSRFCWFWPGR